VGGTAAVFFDVDFTLIHPGPRFQGVGYQASCARYGISVDAARFDAAVAAASVLLQSDGLEYDDAVFISYTRRIIELMGGTGEDLDCVARELYAEWAEHHHFSLYDDVADTLRDLRTQGTRLGLISNSHRCLASFQSHFELDGLISVAVSSSEHGFMKPHPSIFERALDQAGVPAAEAMMIGDSLRADIEGAVALGMRGLLLRRSGDIPKNLPAGVTVITSLHDLLPLV
jgi:putative hydrolase of the HAD superfamily